MPEPYWPKRKGPPFPLSKLNDGRRLVRIECRYCKRRHNYYPSDLIEIFGDLEVDDVGSRIRTCEHCGKEALHIDIFVPQGKEGVGLKIRRLVAIKIKRVPIWREE